MHASVCVWSQHLLCSRYSAVYKSCKVSELQWPSAAETIAPREINDSKAYDILTSPIAPEFSSPFPSLPPLLLSISRLSKMIVDSILRAHPQHKRFGPAMNDRPDERSPEPVQRVHLLVPVEIASDGHLGQSPPACAQPKLWGGAKKDMVILAVQEKNEERLLYDHEMR
ncbi:unnamed protein product [Protopolystoma xenopodis]|uniref:Uncharacterized protein n=1 Tax=Protopolystoma xenopodis TaxID=117903 RepID=A0A3S5AVP2_9PLAT|nr:unnamed protein product [Protopolystoma xenopodis]